ncbi:MAG TPA: LysR substrate-binding domain-containing protein, partial [Pseudonocardiaceae bacterium]|nr:LysR substrate-binding domain-containing protein [Pseudonocardiaceae bacterium]
DDNSCLLRSCAAAGFEPRVAARVQDRDTARELVLAGVGVTLVPAGADPSDPSAGSTGVVSVPLVGTTYRRIEVVHPADCSAATAGFVAGLRHGPPGEHLSVDGVAR